MNRPRPIASGKPQLPGDARQPYLSSDLKPPGTEPLEHDHPSRHPQLAPYGSPSPSTHSISQPHHGYSNLNQPGPVARSQSDSSSYYSYPGAYTAPSVSSSYQPQNSENMAVAHGMRPQMPPNVYHTPQSHSPASVHSPQDHHGRPMFASPPQNLYYPHYSQQQSPYMSQHPMLQHPSLAPQQPSPQHYQQPSYQQGPPLPQHIQPHQQAPPPPLLDQSHRPSPAQPQRTNTANAAPQITSKPSAVPRPGHAADHASSQSANPGPIPATTPQVSKTDANGTQYITFEYSKDRVKVQYEIRCDVESVDLRSLSDSFKETNCVYPRACNAKENYRGNRLAYETQCNELGWALANLNEELRGKRGLIQRAVDSWRNSNSDVNLRSRRVRRLIKNQRRNANSQAHNQIASQHQHASSSASSRSMPPVIQSQAHGMPTAANTTEAAHHHQMHPDSSLQTRGLDSIPHPGSHPNMKSPSQSIDIRPIHNFYPSYPLDHSVGSNSLPSVTYDTFSSIGPRSTTNTVATTIPSAQTEDSESSTTPTVTAVGAPSTHANHLPSLKNPKHFTIHDRRDGVGVRVKFDLESVNPGAIPSPFRLINSVYPRSHVVRGDVPQGNSLDGDVDDGESMPLPKTIVPVRLEDGWESEVSVPRMGKARRSRERILNECSSRITWEHTQSFDKRPLLLAQAVNTYRTEVRKRLTNGGHTIPSHFLSRRGKSRWAESSSRD